MTLRARLLRRAAPRNDRRSALSLRAKRSNLFDRKRCGAVFQEKEKITNIAVGTPVARRPPHRSRRAVFPHRALQKDSLLQKTLRPSLLFPSVRLAWLFRHGRPDQVSCVGCVFLSAPSPLRTALPFSESTTSGSDFLQTIGSPSFGRVRLPASRFPGLPSSVEAPAYFRLRVSPSVAHYPFALQPSSSSTPRNQESEGSPKFLALPFTHTAL